MPDHARVFFEHIAAGAAGVGRTLADLDLQAGGVVAFGDDLERLIAPRKSGLAFSLDAMGSRRHNFYNDAYQRAGYADTAIEVQRLWLEGKRDEAARRVRHDLVRKTSPPGPARVWAEAEVWRGRGDSVRNGAGGRRSRDARRDARTPDGPRPRDLARGRGAGRLRQHLRRGLLHDRALEEVRVHLAPEAHRVREHE